MPDYQNLVGLSLKDIEQEFNDDESSFEKNDKIIIKNNINKKKQFKQFCDNND